MARVSLFAVAVEVKRKGSQRTFGRLPVCIYAYLTMRGARKLALYGVKRTTTFIMTLRADARDLCLRLAYAVTITIAILARSKVHFTPRRVLHSVTPSSTSHSSSASRLTSGLHASDVDSEQSSSPSSPPSHRLLALVSFPHYHCISI